MIKNPLEKDLEHILAHTPEVWRELRDARLFVTGGTGFFGSWLLNTLCWANDQLDLGNEMVVLSRDPSAFLGRNPEFANRSDVLFHRGEVQNFEFPNGRFTHVIHAATPASAKVNDETPQTMFDIVLKGTERTLEFAKISGAKKFLLTSSGAIYGKQPSEMTHIDEGYMGGPDPLNIASAYGEAKRAAEFLCSVYHREYGLETQIARCFAFVGPYLPLDIHFAIGNFIRDAIAGGPIVIKGDGTPYRSYLYAADLMIWLFTILVKGRPCRPYNVGSDDDRPLSEIANAVARNTQQNVSVEIRTKAISGKSPERYVPSTTRAKTELNLKQTIDLDDAIRRTIAWNTRDLGAR